MIDASLLRKMGWSNELIDAVDRVAKPLRANPAAQIPLPTFPGVRSTASSAIYGEAVTQNTATVIEVSEEPEPSEK